VQWFELSDPHTGMTTSSAGDAGGWLELLTAHRTDCEATLALAEITWISA
jgi:hypothetical protein